MKKLLLALVATIATVAYPDVDKHEQGRINREKFIRATGGFITDKRSASGHASIINAQTRVKAELIKAKANTLEKMVWFNVQYTESPIKVSLENIKSAVSETGANACVFLIDTNQLPALLVLPEIRCAVVNVSELAKDCKDTANLEGRVSKEITRAFCSAFGVGYSARPGGLMDPIKSPSELDQILVDVIGMDILPAVSRSAEQFGIRKYRRSTYLKACQEGWAPAPTNDVQKAIWDKVHAMPTEPLKIKPETNKQDK